MSETSSNLSNRYINKMFLRDDYNNAIVLFTNYKPSVIKKWLMIYKYSKHIKDNYCRGVAGCTGCLNKCPKGVKVNDINRCLTYANGYGDIELAREKYLMLSCNENIDICTDCDTCMVKCVNGLNLTENIKRARELFA